MILPAQNIRVMLAVKPVDFRKGHDGLAVLVASQLRLDPYSGVVVVFRSRRLDRIKVLVWDGSGLVMVYKRLEQGGFAWPPIRDGVMRLAAAQFEALFSGMDWRRVHVPDMAAPSAAE
jgi:transposase